MWPRKGMIFRNIRPVLNKERAKDLSEHVSEGSHRITLNADY